MAKAVPGEHKTVQARILLYAQEIGWRYVPRAEAEMRRGFDSDAATPEEQTRSAMLYFGDLLHTKVRAFNPKYKEAEGALPGELQRLTSDIAGNRDFLTYLRNQGKFFCAEESRELDLVLIDYDDATRPTKQWRNYEVTEEFVVHNGRYGTREDVVFLINGVPILVIKCKNATKDEAIALGVDQIRRYHEETPEAMVPEMLFTATEAIGFAYGVTWNTVRRNIFRWKHEEVGNLEAKVKSFCSVPHLLRLLKDFILFAEKEEELQKLILRQHLRDKERRKEFFKEYKEIEMLYEIISPDAFLRPYMDDYITLSSIYAVVQNAYTRKVYVDRAFQKKTNELVQKHIGSLMTEPPSHYLAIDKSTIDAIKEREEGDASKVTFALVAEDDDLERVTATVEALFNLLHKSFRT